MTDYRRHAAVLFGLAAAMALAGSLLPWALVPVRQPGGGVRLEARTALHGDGALTAAAAGAGLALALLCAWKPARRAQLFGMLCFAGAVLVIALVVRSRFPPGWGVEPGLYLTIAGGAVMSAATVLFTWALQRAPPEVSEGPLPIIRE